MTAFLHALIDIAFFSAMMYLLSMRIDNLEEDYDELEERVIDLEAKEIAESCEVNYLMEQAEKQPKSG